MSTYYKDPGVLERIKGVIQSMGGWKKDALPRRDIMTYNYILAWSPDTNQQRY